MDKKADKTYSYIHELRNREMALRAKIFASPLGGKIEFSYGHDYFQEEVRSMGLRMMRDGLRKEGEKLILDYTEQHYPSDLENERIWITKMIRYLRAITDPLIDNLQAEQYIALQGNIDLPSENVLFYPIKELNEESNDSLIIGFNNVIALNQTESTLEVTGWVYYRSE